MSRTPIKTESLEYPSPKDLISPKKDQTGFVRTLFTHISGIHSQLTLWFKVLEKGTVIVKSISALKLHECCDDYYPYQLKKLMEELLEITNDLKEIVYDVCDIKKQLTALAQLNISQGAVVNTWHTAHFTSQVSCLYISMCKEFNIKEIITENIAHCRDEKLIEVYASAWEHNMYVNLESIAYMFADVGLSAIEQEIL